MDTWEAEFEARYRELGRAVAARDEDVLAGILAPGYTYTSPEGTRMPRAVILALELEIPPPEAIGGLSVQPVTRDVAIVRGHNFLQGEFPPGSIGDALAASIESGVRIDFTSVWHRANGTWQLVSNDAHVDGGHGG